VNHDEAARRSVRARQLLVEAHPRSDAARYIVRVARKLAGEATARRPGRPRAR
jgi:MinD-like ATPase involved in chromosome partitioning or flagellar assembly